MKVTISTNAAENLDRDVLWGGVTAISWDRIVSALIENGNLTLSKHEQILGIELQSDGMLIQIGYKD